MYYLIIVISSILYIIIKTKKNTQIFQQNFYNENNRYLIWGSKNLSKVFNIYDITLCIINLINIFIKSKILILFNILYLVIYIIENKKLKKEQVKIPLKITKRVIKLFVTLFLIVSLFIYILMNYSVYTFNFIYSLIILFNFYIIFFANIINWPIDKIVYLCYLYKSKNKFKTLNNLEVIGITGSYGKTSSKNILNEILSVKYNSVTTPKNYNTKYGIMITINNYINQFHDIFVAEMGAFKVGSIKSLCKIVKPKYGIITNIGTAHLETFKSRENIRKAKFELINSLPSDGVAILNGDDEYQINYETKSKCKKIWIAIKNKNADIIANNIKIDSNGMNFNVYFKEDKKEYEFSTKLLGEANVYNILGAIAFGKYKGMTIQELQYGVRKLKPIPHRLERKKVGNKTIIDDAYNSNPVGSKMALDVLKLMDGIKIVVTPGMIELGEEEYNLNKKYGEYISEVADYVILVGKNQTKPIYDGLIQKKFNKTKIIIINDIKEAFKIIDEIKSEKEKYILLENDLPDIFNETKKEG